MTSDATGTGRQLARARRALAAVFAVHGAVAGGFATRIPWLQDRLGLTSGQLGLALAFPALASACAMPFASRVVRRLGSRAGLRLLLALWCASLALPALSPGLPALCAALACYGATSGTADVAMNALGVRTEERLGRPVMSSLHGMWCVGTLAGSAVGTAAAHAGLDARLHLGLAAGVLAAVGLVVCRWVLDPPPAPAPVPAAGARRRARELLPVRGVLVIGAVGFCAVFAEGASLDWSAVYLRDVLDAGAGLAAGCTTVFSCAMAGARLAGDAVVRRLGAVRTVRAGGLLAVAGGALVVAAPSAGGSGAAVAGFALIGVGVSVVVPLAFAAAGRGGRDAGRSIATVATVVYTSGLIAPTVIGRIADAASLPVSFAVVTALTAGLVAGAGVLRAPARATAAPRGAAVGAEGDRSEGEEPEGEGSEGEEEDGTRGERPGRTAGP
ncbi:MFS transporter [Streptomyces gamaensis]|uniref:MFS transporter n=1 Tax=Streptomyces gamaensis TaxID=1763542 RepID=A0ABW0ZCT8_9ACTN